MSSCDNADFTTVAVFEFVSSCTMTGLKFATAAKSLLLTKNLSLYSKDTRIFLIDSEPGLFKTKNTNPNSGFLVSRVGAITNIVTGCFRNFLGTSFGGSRKSKVRLSLARLNWFCQKKT